jgi:type IV pilus assembly protein PilF
MRTAQLFILSCCLGLTAACTTTTNADPNNASPERAIVYNVQLGMQYLRQGRRDLARLRLERALEIDDRSPAANSAMAYYWEQVGEIERADASHRRAVRYGDDDPNIANNYGTFLCQQGRYEESEAYFLSAARSVDYLTPEAAYANAGACQRRAGNPERAEELLRRALTISPRFADALWHMADLRFDQGDALTARAFLQRLEAEGQLSASMLYLGVRIERTMGDDAAADDYARRLVRNYPNSEQARRLGAGEGR